MSKDAAPTETWLILGASSVIARAFADRAAAVGCRVILAGRDLEEMEASAKNLAVRKQVTAEAIEFDAVDYQSHQGFACAVSESVAGTLNILLAFGIMPAQADTERDFSCFHDMAETNYLGAVSILDRLAPFLEQRCAGRVVIIGSVSGERGRRQNYAYGSTKAALHAYASGLRARLFRSGISVTTVLPGFVDTSMTWGLPGLMFMASPDEVALGIWNAAERRAGVVHFRRIWGLVMWIIRSIPEPIFKRLDI